MKFLWLLLTTAIFWGQTDRALHDNWEFRAVGDAEFISASVPGTVHTDLLRHQIIPDPHFGTNEKQVQWVEEKTWEYQTTFSVSDQELSAKNVELIFEGLDTYSIITLNGTTIGTTDNMFRRWEFAVKNLLGKGKNSLKVSFAPAAEYGKTEARKLPYTLPENERVFSRKAQYQYGWDWGPRLVTAGIWQPVKLRFWDNAKLQNASHEITSLTAEKANLMFTVSIDCGKAGGYRIKINDTFKKVSLKKGINKVLIPYEIENPKLWWTTGLGEPHLYPIEIGLYENKNKIGETNMNVGLRTIELIRNADEKGETFYFKLNGKSVFMKGANVIPADNFLPRKTSSDYEKLVIDAKAANMNMLRIWGGGVYPTDDFMDACDRAGILVWQDFMFACALYPHDEKFLKTVKHEVIDQVNRLQNHASLALWCGNNENDEAWHNWGWQKQFNYSGSDSTDIWDGYKKLFHQLIPKTLDSLLPKSKNIYWPSSPSIGWGRKESLLRGDSHYWGVWWGKQPFEIYRQKIPRFMSEFGFQSIPSVETMQKWLPPDGLSLTSDAMKNHQKHPTGFETINEYMQRDYKIPAKFEDYTYVSQLLQARGMKIAIEAHRRAMPYCMGSLYWQLNDCWPVVSWSSIDSEGRWKAFHYQAKRSFENTILSVGEADGKLWIYLVNDTDAKSGVLKLALKKFDGTTIWSEEKTISVRSQESAKVFALPQMDFDKSAAVLSMRFESGKTIESAYFFAKPKDLKLTKPTIDARKIDSKTWEITADVLAKDVVIESADAKPDDNFFDILPGGKKVIHFDKSPSEVKLKSLFDTL